MKNVFGFALVALLAACGGNICEQAADELEACVDGTGTGTATVTATVTADECEDGSEEACGAQCVVDAIDANGCEGVLDLNKNGDYLNCALDCLDAGTTDPKKKTTPTM